ncbi:hypothetical protein BRADI_3g57083v3 [Brachypodium distachyon]|uniref:Uncharacterized protein n=1 Tax=Brachypodium distachyon TaxID=15368 RepID=A0A2K2D5G5_BRADI|nr:hypothetical protein BRADI_3g57083v3 [Brachypodium distachyon]
MCPTQSVEKLFYKLDTSSIYKVDTAQASCLQKKGNMFPLEKDICSITKKKRAFDQGKVCEEENPTLLFF